MIVRFLNRIVAIIICFLPCLLQGQNYIVNVQKFGIEEGLSHRDTKCAFQDSRGFIWIGTHYGLNRFDGHNFKIFTKENHGLADNLVSHIQEDADGWLWIFNWKYDKENNSYKGISFLNIYTNEIVDFETRFGNNGLLKKEEIFSVLNTPQNVIYIGTTNGRILKFHPSTGFELIKKLPTSDILLEKYASQHTLFFKQLFSETQESYYEIDTLGYQHWHFPKAKHFQYLGEDKARTKWFLQHQKNERDSIKLFNLEADYQLKTFNKNTAKNFKNWRSSYFYGQVSRGDDIWFFGLNKMIAFNPEIGEILDFTADFPVMCENGLNDIFFDNRKNAWVCTESGIYKVQLNPNPLKNYLSQNKEDLGLNAGISCRGMEERKGELWVNTTSDIQYRIDLTTEEVSIANIPLSRDGNSNRWDSKNLLNVLKVDSDYLLFAGALDVLYKPSTEDPKIIPRHTGHATHTWVWFRDSHGKFYSGLKDDGIGYWNTEKDSVLFFNQYNEFKTLRKSTVYAFLQLDKEHILVGSTSGLYLLHHTKGIIQRFWSGGMNEFFFPHDAIYHLYQDKKDKNIVWVATGGGGLIKWKNQLTTSGGYEQFTNANGLSSNVIYAVYEDDKENLWMPSDYGIIRFHKKSHNAKAFLQKDGISHHEFNRMSHEQDVNGNLYFGGLNGITAFHPNELSEEETLFDAPLEILSFQKFDTKLNKLADQTAQLITDNKIQLKPGEQFFRIDFSLLNYQDATQIRYAYQIEGQDENWNLIKENYLRISGLPYGNYTLRVKGQGVSGEFSVRELNIPIEVLKPLYLETWFIIASIIGSFCGLYFFNHWRIRNLKRQRKELQNSIKEATKTIREQNENLKRDNQTIEKQAQELQKLDELKSHFFANVSHELRTPLTLIIGPLQSILRQKDPKEKDFKLLTKMRLNGKKLNRLINQILDLSKLEVGKLKLRPKPTLIYVATRRILAAFESYADWENIKLSFEYKTKKDLKIDLDVEQYETVLNNLLSNAFKFTNRGGAVTVTLENLGQNIRISVQDTGRGIHPDDLPQIFNRYFQTAQTNAPAEGGTGIGLALSYEIAKLFNGDLRVESELHKGSLFIFEFPLKEIFGKLTDAESIEIDTDGILISDFGDLNDVKPSENQQTTRIENQPRKTILIVEDNFDLRKYIKTILEDKYDILEANNGEVAWKILKEQTDIPPPHLIISDLMMPIMDGYQLVQKLKGKELFRNIPIVILTAKASSEDKLKALRIGVDDYLLKPFDEEELKARVENLLKHSEWRAAFQKETIDIPVKNKETKSVKETIELTKVDEDWLSDLEKTTLANIGNFNFSIEQLAHEMATSRWQLNRRLKQFTGLTASQYLLETRLNQARTLFEEGHHDSVKAVTYSVGLKDLQNFSKKFKARFGKSPSEYL